MVALPLGVLDHLGGRSYLKCAPNETCDRTQKCVEASTLRGRRWGEGIGVGGEGEGDVGDATSCSHRAQGGLWLRPTNGLGSCERLCRGGWGAPGNGRRGYVATANRA